MENDELLKRILDLEHRCNKNCEITSSFFLTPAEQQLAKTSSAFHSDSIALLSGGDEHCERKALFFLPYYMSEEDFSPDENICAVKIKAYFGQPGHRDYLGAILGLGIRREWVGDIRIFDDTAYVFCLESVKQHLVASLDKVGRCGVKTAEISLSEVPAPKLEYKHLSFTVKSPRLDAIAAGMFNISRTESAKHIEAGLVNLNYLECLRTDMAVKTGDIISIRGYGKGTVTLGDAFSKKGRLFVEAEICK